MNTSAEWKQGWMSGTDGLGVIAQGRQAELVQDAHLDQLDNSSQSMHIRLARRLLHIASVIAMALQTAQWSV